MSLVLYALLNSSAPVISTAALEAGMRSMFGGDTRFSLDTNRLPFTDAEMLLLRWDGWTVGVCYEVGDQVREDSVEIAGRLESPLPDPEDFDRRVRLIFPDDPHRDYTNEIIQVMDYFYVMPGTSIVDIENNLIVRY